jgi:hypothetical protein
VEFAVLLPVLLIAALVAVPVILRIQEANRLDQAVGAAIRYATKAAPNSFASSPEDPPGTCPDLRRRRSADEVRNFLSLASEGIVTPDQVAVLVTPANPGTQTVNPCRGIPGSVVSVTATWTNDVGFVGELANNLVGLIGLPPVITPSSRDLTAQGVLE